MLCFEDGSIYIVGGVGSRLSVDLKFNFFFGCVLPGEGPSHEIVEDIDEGLQIVFFGGEAEMGIS